jgi:hypothetical protein
MKTFKILLISLFLISLIPPVLAGEQEKSAEEQKMMEVWMKYATPGEGHKLLAKFVGEWQTTNKSWSKPGAEPEVSTGSASGKLFFGGRYLKMKYQGKFMGMDFEGIGIHAFDNHSKKYLSTWMDNMGTGIMLSTGTLDEAGTVLTDWAEVDDIFTGKKIKVKSVTSFLSADKMVMEMYMVGPEGEFKNLEITHIRKK